MCQQTSVAVDTAGVMGKARDGIRKRAKAKARARVRGKAECRPEDLKIFQAKLLLRTESKSVKARIRWSVFRRISTRPRTSNGHLSARFRRQGQGWGQGDSPGRGQYQTTVWIHAAIVRHRS